MNADVAVLQNPETRSADRAASRTGRGINGADVAVAGSMLIYGRTLPRFPQSIRRHRVPWGYWDVIAGISANEVENMLRENGWTAERECATQTYEAYSFSASEAITRALQRSGNGVRQELFNGLVVTRMGLRRYLAIYHAIVNVVGVRIKPAVDLLARNKDVREDHE
jgi:hypothetical protein